MSSTMSSPETSLLVASILQRKLYSEHLKKGVIRLVNHSLLDDGKAGISNEEELLIQISALDDITVNHSVDYRESFFIHEMSVYIGNIPSTLVNELYLAVAKMVDKVIGGLLVGVLDSVVKILECDEDSINSCLDVMGVREYKMSIILPYIFRPRIGSFVPLKWHKFLLSEIHLFDVDTLVALELDDPLEECAVSNADTADPSVYKIGKIIEMVAACSEEKDSINNLLTVQYRVDIGEPEAEIVQGIALYAFDRQVCKHMAGPLQELMLRSVATSSELPGTMLSPGVEFRNVMEHLMKFVNRAWKLPSPQQKKVIKRLYLVWHPQRNDSQYREVCGNAIASLKQLLVHHKGSNFSSSSGVILNFQLLDQRAEQSALSAADGEDVTDGLAMFLTHSPNPQPREARRWIQQASLDVQSARNDVGSTNCQSHEWACFKCHQAVEKALKAAHFTIDSNRTLTHNLSSLCHFLGSDWLESKVNDISRLLVRSEAMRYPDCHNYPRIPHEVYKGRADKAIRLATEIVEFVQHQFIGAI